MLISTVLSATLMGACTVAFWSHQTFHFKWMCAAKVVRTTAVILPKMAPINGDDVHCTMHSRSISAGPSIATEMGIAFMALLAAGPIVRTSRPAHDPLPAAAAIVAPVAGNPSLKAVAKQR